MKRWKITAMEKETLRNIQRIGKWCVLWEVIETNSDEEPETIIKRYRDAKNAAEYAAGHIEYGVRMGLYKPEWIGYIRKSGYVVKVSDSGKNE